MDIPELDPSYSAETESSTKERHFGEAGPASLDSVAENAAAARAGLED